MKYLALAFVLTFSGPAFAQDNSGGQDPTPVMTPNQLKHYPFAPDTRQEKPPVIKDLSVTQQYYLTRDRRMFKDLAARHLGILEIHGDKTDLSTIQQLYDRHILKDNQVAQWQAVGVVFGDILANELDLHWVSYADEKGVSTALQWKNTKNFVFPVTMFSKRIKFNEKIDAKAIYDKIARDVKDFIAYENSKPTE